MSLLMLLFLLCSFLCLFGFPTFSAFYLLNCPLHSFFFISASSTFALCVYFSFISFMYLSLHALMETDSGQNFSPQDRVGDEKVLKDFTSPFFPPQGYLGEREEFLLFASLFEVTMMDSSVGTRPLTFELSIGKQCILCAECNICWLTDTSILGLLRNAKIYFCDQ